MFKEWRRHRAAQRVKPGNGRPLKPFRWWQLTFRALAHPPARRGGLRAAPVAERSGTFTSPVHLPVWLNTALALGAAAASTERALRLRCNWLPDSAAQG
ncbi:hypothetical protein HGB44_09960 [Nocardiopsis dassonvillei subsp. albirubida]|uniref:Uncharacterized protein n=1 Tax=Nocardiopsis alborubida TaxID=146802 RepID=A0A7X6MDW8_9ACTN|nr:hypothetical protein [Nocardiopsis alborubida]NKY97978.1 hypothetical protein [Nocardiopsis alborubida]